MLENEMIDKRLDELKTSNEVDTVILCGIETHVCIVATCIDLIHRGFNVIFISLSRFYIKPLHSCVFTLNFYFLILKIEKLSLVQSASTHFLKLCSNSRLLLVSYYKYPFYYKCPFQKIGKVPIKSTL